MVETNTTHSTNQLLATNPDTMLPFRKETIKSKIISYVSGDKKTRYLDPQKNVMLENAKKNALKNALKNA